MRVSILMVRALAATVERAGASRERFLSAAAIDPAWIDEGTMWLSAVEYVRAAEAALAISGEPALGLRLGEQMRPSMFDVIGPLIEQTATLRESIATMAKYSRLMAEGYDAELHEAGDRASIRFSALRGDFALVRLTAEFSMMGLASTLELFAGPSGKPSEVRFAYPAPPYAAEYRRVFGGAERFDSEHTELVFPSAWLDRPQPYSNPELHAVLKDQAERKLKRLERDASVIERAERILEQRDAGTLTMDDVARALNMSGRSLRRQLQLEGVSFADLVARARTRFAKRMLERPGTTIQEAAYAMGFASSAAFHRAFKRWTGLTPKQYQDSF